MLRKWRTAHKSIYTIPEIHGNISSLETIIDRILPLRFHIHQEDIIVFLGDYIDKGEDTASVIDCLINIKAEYGERSIFIKGNHEEYMLRALYGNDNDLKDWIDKGGAATLSSYIKKAKLSTTPYSIARNRLFDIIPKSHIDFLKELKAYHIHDNYLFFHGGFNHEKSIEENNISNFPFDYTSSRYIKTCIKNKTSPIFKDDYIYVGAHNYMEKAPILHSKYFMLGGNAPSRLFVFELNSMSACAVKNGKSRLYKYNFKFFE